MASCINIAPENMSAYKRKSDRLSNIYIHEGILHSHTCILRDNLITNYLKLRLHFLLCVGMDSVTPPKHSMVPFI